MRSQLQHWSTTVSFNQKKPIIFTQTMTMNRIFILSFLIITFSLSGCVTTATHRLEAFGTAVKATMQGDYYLSGQHYQAGEKQFQQAVEEHPDSALNNYFYGRMLLANNKNKKGLPYLQKASKLEPGNADYHFWTGVAHGSMNQRNQERERYKKALSLEKKHLQALLY